MGCTASVETAENWRTRTELLEAEVMKCIGWKEGEYIAKYTNIDWMGKPF